MSSHSDISSKSSKRNMHTVFNSVSQVPDFSGVDDIKTAENHSKIHKKGNSSSALSRLKNVFSQNRNQHNRKPTKPKQESRRRIKRRKPKMKSKLKLRKYASDDTESITPINVSPMQAEWRPTLKVIRDDPLLLTALTKFTEKQYNSENILFLNAVKALREKTMHDIDDDILSIYDQYIVQNAPFQINVSYQCLMDVLSKKQEMVCFNLYQKRSMFDQCEDEIAYLVTISILPSFYYSLLFKSVAKQSKYNKVKLKVYHSNYLSIESSYSPTTPSSSLRTPPIKLEMSSSSCSTEYS